ncbi:MAG: hypothetical protein DRN81_06140 [Thermoproteota archaeon]|nr:MAG: hypothetical protein DRN81_06140 [Candidatus Korarchaeota archaeon]
MGRKIVEVVIGTVEVGGPGPGPGPGPSPSVIDSFIEEHRKLKNILDRYGAQGMCVPRSVLERESGIAGKRLDQHLRVFEGSDTAATITEEGEEVLCGKTAIEELKKKIKLELGE